jgi:hypothetical protein
LIATVVTPAAGATAAAAVVAAATAAGAASIPSAPPAGGDALSGRGPVLSSLPVVDDVVDNSAAAEVAATISWVVEEVSLLVAFVVAGSGLISGSDDMLRCSFFYVFTFYFFFF